jgi:Mn-dependent DtxR family transcriptional regulator
MIRDLIGNTAIIRVIDFLLDEWELDFSKADVARETGVSWKTINEIWKKLETFGLIKYSRTINRAKLYKVNTESAVYKALTKLDFEMLKVQDELADEVV